MGSDNFERVFKLWVSLWELVLNEKRHLEAVCTTLQKLVFEFRGYPKFRNWQAICEIKDWCLKMTLARVDLLSDVGRRLQAAFPECFAYEKDRGPIPVSILREYSRKKGTGDGIDRSDYLMLTETLQHFNVPSLSLFVDPDERNSEWCDASVTYEEALAMGFQDVGFDNSFGKIVKYQGQDYFVAEVSGEMEIYLVPVEALVIDI